MDGVGQKTEFGKLGTIFNSMLDISVDYSNLELPGKTSSVE